MKSRARRAGKLMSSTILCSSCECFELNGRGQTFKIVMHRYHFLELDADFLYTAYIMYPSQIKQATLIIFKGCQQNGLLRYGIILCKQK